MNQEQIDAVLAMDWEKRCAFTFVLVTSTVEQMVDVFDQLPENRRLRKSRVKAFLAPIIALGEVLETMSLEFAAEQFRGDMP